MRYLITFSYDGSKYNGYQKQPKVRTIQGELEKSLKKINSNKSVGIIASGRTDAGVHAYGQSAHFDLDKDIACSKLKQALNSLLPDDIYIKTVSKVANNERTTDFNVSPNSPHGSIRNLPMHVSKIQ